MPYNNNNIRRSNSNGNASPKRRSSSFSNNTGGGGVQQIYELLFCLWCMTLDCASNDQMRDHFHRDGAIVALAQLCESSLREKITRLAISSLCNLAQLPFTGGRCGLVQEMIGCGVLKSVELLQERQSWKDPEFLEGTCAVNI